MHGDRLQPHGSRLRFCREECLDRLDDADNHDRLSVHRKREQKRLPAASVSGVVKSTVAMSSGTQVSCVTTARRVQSSGTTAGTLAGTIDVTRSSFSAVFK